MHSRTVKRFQEVKYLQWSHVSDGVADGAMVSQHHRLQGPFRVQRHRRGCQHESSSIEDEISHQRHPKDGGRSRSQRIQLRTPWHVTRGVKDQAPRRRDAWNGSFPSDANRVALGGGAKETKKRCPQELEEF